MATKRKTVVPTEEVEVSEVMTAVPADDTDVTSAETAVVDETTAETPATNDVMNETAATPEEPVPAEAKKKDNSHRIRYDYETGYVLLRVSANTDVRKLGGAISKHFKDGAKALVVSFIGLNTMAIALKGICAAQEYLPNENVERLNGKKLAIVPEFHSFENENGKVNTQKLTLYLVDELKP